MYILKLYLCIYPICIPRPRRWPFKSLVSGTSFRKAMDIMIPTHALLEEFPEHCAMSSANAMLLMFDHHYP